MQCFSACSCNLQSSSQLQVDVAIPCWHKVTLCTIMLMPTAGGCAAIQHVGAYWHYTWTIFCHAYPKYRRVAIQCSDAKWHESVISKILNCDQQNDIKPEKENREMQTELKKKKAIKLTFTVKWLVLEERSQWTVSDQNGLCFSGLLACNRQTSKDFCSTTLHLKALSSWAVALHQRTLPGTLAKFSELTCTDDHVSSTSEMMCFECFMD